MELNNLSNAQIKQLQQALTPRLNKYIPIVPTAKQTAAMLLNTTREILYGGAAGGGKAIDVNTPILTANRGWQTMASLCIGDKVFGRDGEPTTVYAKSPVYFGHDCYELVFDNDEVIIADGEHQWIIDEYQNRVAHRIMTTEEIFYTKGNRTNHAIYKSAPLNMEEKELICHPYAFGVWLGDGSTRQGDLACTDSEIHERLQELGYDIYQTADKHTWKSTKLRAELRRMGFIRQDGSVQKSIPMEYMYASKQQRYMLLLGLMDTDGNASSDRGYCSICMVNAGLMLQIEELIRSLGIKVTLRTSIATCGQTGAKCDKYTLKWSTPIKMFTLGYKLERQKLDSFRSVKSKHYVKQVNRVCSVPVQCISVDNPEHCYLAGKGLIPTHNSVFLLAAALQYVDVPGYSAILFRKTFSDLMLPGALIPMSQQWLAPYLSSGEVTWRDKEKRYTFEEYGTTLSFGYLENKGDHLRYQGSEFQFVGMDEVTHIVPESYRYLFSRLRRIKGSNIPIRMRATANPGGPYGEYYYQRFFVDNIDENGKALRLFLQAGLRDNPHLDAEEYRQALAELDPITRAQLEHGDWEIRPKGDLFDKSWIISIDHQGIPSSVRWVRFWDLAAIDPKHRKKTKQSKEPDWTVGFKLGMANGCYYIADIIKVQKSPGDVETLIYNTALQDGHACAIEMEQEGGASGIATIERYQRNILQGYNFRGVHPVTSKIERARPVAAAAQSGAIFLSNRCRNILDFYSQLDAFPNGANDDIVDAFSGAFAHFKPKAGNMSPPPPFRPKLQQYTETDILRPRVQQGSYWLRSMGPR